MKSCKNLLTSIGHCCPALVEGSLWPVFGLRLALQAFVSASNDGIISFPKEKPMVRTPHCWAYITELGNLGLVRGSVALQIGVKSDHLAAAWAFKIVATAMRAEQVALFWNQSDPTSTCLVNFL